MSNLYYHKLVVMLRKNKHLPKQFIGVGIVVALLTMSFLPTQLVSANPYQDEINSLNKKIEENSSVLEDLHHEANSLQAKLNSLQAEINVIDASISKTKLQIKQVKQQLKEAEAKLERQKEILAENVRTLYKEGDVSTIEVLASSENFSDFVNRQEYLESIKIGIQEAAKEVVKLKEELEQRESELSDLLSKQKAQQNSLTLKRNEQASLLAETRGQEARYQSIVEDLKRQREEAEEALRKFLAAGRFVDLGPVAEGAAIGRVGNTGFSSGPHLHFEVRQPDGEVTDPKPFLRAGWAWPVPEADWQITQDYGNPDPIYYRGWHPGIDTGSIGQTVVAMASGTVIARGCSEDFLGTKAYGYMVMVEHDNGHTSLYAHMVPPSGAYGHCNYSYGF